MAADRFHVAPEHQPLLRQAGLDAHAVFTHGDIAVWRDIGDRQNCTLDVPLADGGTRRLHIKRYAAVRGGDPAQREAEGIEALRSRGIATVDLVGWGTLADGRGFVITLDLEGRQACDKLVAGGMDFERLLKPTAALAARLHGSGLHHRDLYLCHFFARSDGGDAGLTLIDAARVRPLPRWPLRQRWIVKDLAQFFHSLREAGIGEEVRRRWLETYARERGLPSMETLPGAIERKAAWIARHDARLRRRQPKRNISIPQTLPRTELRP